MTVALSCAHTRIFKLGVPCAVNCPHQPLAAATADRPTRPALSPRRGGGRGVGAPVTGGRPSLLASPRRAVRPVEVGGGVRRVDRPGWSGVTLRPAKKKHTKKKTQNKYTPEMDKQ